MTIDDRLRRAGEQFRAAHTEPADVRLGAPAAARPRTRPARRRLVAVASTVIALAAVTTAVVVWVAAPHRSANRNATAQEAISGTWTLVAARDATGDIPLPVVSRFTPQLRLDLVAGDLTAGDGCNDHNGHVSGDDSSLSFSRMTVTAAGCPDDGAAFRTAIGRLFLPGTATYQLAAARLTITRDGTTLTYVDTVWDLTGTTWRLAGVDASTLPPALQPTIRYTLSVSGTGPDQQLRLDDDCDVTTVPVDVGVEQITVTGQASTTTVDCGRPADPAVTAAARAFGAATIFWSIAGNVLSIAGSGTIATFDAS